MEEEENMERGERGEMNGEDEEGPAIFDLVSPVQGKIKIIECVGD